MTYGSPRNARSRRTRDALLTAARRILEDDGFASLTMGLVAERAGVTRRAVYLHFTSRGELVRALFDHIAEQEGLAESLAPVWSAPDAVQALHAWARHVADYHPRLMAVDRAVERMRHHDADAEAHRATVTEKQLGNCRRLAEWLHREGRLAAGWSVEEATDMLFALVSTDLFARLLELRGWSGDDMAEGMWTLHRSTFVAEGRPGESGAADPR